MIDWKTVSLIDAAILGLGLAVVTVIAAAIITAIFTRVPKTFPHLLVGIFVVCALMLFFVMYRTP